MSHRIKQINELLLAELSMLVSEHVVFKDGLITITSVSTSPDLKNTTAFISVLPEGKTGSALKAVRKHSKPFNKQLKGKLNLKFVPNIKWAMDEKIKYMIEIDEVFKQIEEEEDE